VREIQCQNVFRVFSLRFFVSTLADYLSSRCNGWHAAPIAWCLAALPSHSYLAPCQSYLPAFTVSLTKPLIYKVSSH